MESDWQNLGDVNPEHGQLWIKPGGDDYAEYVETIGPGDLESLGDNQLLILRGSIYFSPDHWQAALECCDALNGRAGPPDYLDVARAFHAYHGGDLDTWGGETVVQVGRAPGDAGSWRHHVEPRAADVVLHGNAKIARYIRAEILN